MGLERHALADDEASPFTRMSDADFPELTTRQDAGAVNSLTPAAFVASASGVRGAIVIEVSGELDLAAAPELDRMLGDADPARHVVVDLAGCSFVDSSGLQVLIRHRHRRRGMAVCCTPGGAPSRLFQMTGLADQAEGLHTFASRESALAAYDAR